MSYSTDKCLERVYGVEPEETQKQEDGTAADLGPAPTGHVTHSVDCHDKDEEDDGW